MQPTAFPWFDGACASEGTTEPVRNLAASTKPVMITKGTWKWVMRPQPFSAQKIATAAAASGKSSRSSVLSSRLAVKYDLFKNHAGFLPRS